ncbi:MAG: lipid A biosynthesis acyltransferase [Bacteroidetes bacterium]|nr:MAG: lipid A biosynthesis acyltransferase [Bacteroidota bacterium]
MRITYYIFYGFAWLISLLPFWMLHGLADFIYVLLYYITGYRKKVTNQNLRNAFPDKDEKWIRHTSRKFYRNLADITVEDIKVLTIRQKKLAKRYRYVNTEIMEDIFKQNRSVILACGHCGNWEWMGNTLGPLFINYKGYAIVKPLQNPYFDGFMNGLRNRYIKDSIIYMRDTLRTMVKRKDEVTLYAFAADQTPSNPQAAYWGKFMNQDTPFYLGVEKIARTLDIPVIFIDLYREKRGYYVGELSLITDSSKSTKEGEITEAYMQMLEEAIRRHPGNWLWSHRRWKHKRKQIEKET